VTATTKLWSVWLLIAIAVFIPVCLITGQVVVFKLLVFPILFMMIPLLFAAAIGYMVSCPFHNDGLTSVLTLSLPVVTWLYVLLLIWRHISSSTERDEDATGSINLFIFTVGLPIITTSYTYYVLSNITG